MTQLLTNAGIAGPIPDTFNFKAFLTLPPPLVSVGHSIRFRNAHNCKAEQDNEDSTNITLDCRDYVGHQPVNLNVGHCLHALYPYAKEEFNELVFSEPYCAEVGPLLLFLRRKVVQGRMQEKEKEKSAKDKGPVGKPLHGSMVLMNPSSRIPGQQPAVVLPDIILHSISNKLYPPLNWFTDDHLEFIQHWLHELHTKLTRPIATTDNPSPEKILVFNMAKMITIWGSDESYSCLSPLKWQQASKNLLAALSILSDTLSPQDALTCYTFAGEFGKHRSFFINYRSFEENYTTWYEFERESCHDILKGTLFDRNYYVQQVDGHLLTKAASAVSLLSPPSSPSKRPSDSDLCTSSKVARGSNDTASTWVYVCRKRDREISYISNPILVHIS
ncbi:hypothetical protein BDP27DRAFT_1511087 [Rhodocollybia butyracea]|uniref:Uncharacterized protein n=1 Tax=Rhodocollybia butyracea TaxID=206335 RepID=A0A9P5P8L0_9AGAR|nr:hypothetical protein BDP27DRAFT_1511087 [Rhodocollybia butyracea]